MNKRLILSLAAVALLLPALAVEAPSLAQEAGGNLAARASQGGNQSAGRMSPALGLDKFSSPTLRVLEDARRPETMDQVRIEQRVIIRISPSPPDTREQALASLPRRATRNAFEEVEHADCVLLSAIAGVQPTADNRLLLFMNNRQVLAASLDRSCSARSFYSGFYVERNADGRLCIARDRLQSRAGTSCQVESITRLVAVSG